MHLVLAPTSSAAAHICTAFLQALVNVAAPRAGRIEISAVSGYFAAWPRNRTGSDVGVTRIH